MICLVSSSMKYKYPLPEGVEIRTSQPKGEYAHENFPESRYAVDFLVDIGTPVVAARSGIVLMIKSDSDKWGLDKSLSGEVNFVGIDHGDGSYAEYLHLGKDKVIVRVGDKVNQGDVLGYTGLSGVMDVPHLHFNLFKIEEGEGYSIPVEWD